jgi:serine/threonine protein kinase
VKLRRPKQNVNACHLFVAVRHQAFQENIEYSGNGATSQERKHPNIIGFHGMGLDQNERFVILEYCTGGDLRPMIDEAASQRLFEGRYVMDHLDP